MSFISLGLSEALARAVEDAGYTNPTPVQQRAIPAVLQGRDLMVAAQTGTGKTGGFALPVLERLFPNGHPDGRQHVAKQPRVLVLTPTRELAAQVHDSFKVYARDLPMRSACVFGGVGLKPQVTALAKGVDVLVACPGRLLDLAGQQSVDLSAVEILVLDEADRMLDMGFIHDVKKVLARLPARRQNLLFSATFSKDITDLAGKLLQDPERIEVTPPNTTVERIEQRLFRIPANQKRALLAHLITLGAWEQVLVFTRTKHGANRLAEYLNKHGLPAAPIHGNKSQNARTKALADFKSNEVRVLVATDIAARGLDIDQLPHVVNFELPNVEEDYVHRIGRTGRAGRSGEAISLVSPDEEKLLKAIERLTKQSIPDGDMQGFDPQSVPPEQPEVRAPREPRGKPQQNRQKKADKPARSEGKGQNQGQGKAASGEQSGAQPQGERKGRTRNRRDRRDRDDAGQPMRNPARPRPSSRAIAIRKSSWTTITTTSATASTTSAPTRARVATASAVATAATVPVRQPRAAMVSSPVRVKARARALPAPSVASNSSSPASAVARMASPAPPAPTRPHPASRVPMPRKSGHRASRNRRSCTSRRVPTACLPWSSWKTCRAGRAARSPRC